MNAWLVLVPLMLADPPAAVTGPPTSSAVRFADPDIHIKPGRLGRVTVQFPGTKPIKWINLNDDLDLIPSESGRYAIVASAYSRTYRIAVYSADAEGNPTEPAYCNVIVDGPPVPPVPPPDTDPLAIDLKRLYRTTDAVNVGRLASVYEKAASITVDDKNILTMFDLQNVLKAAAATLVPLPALQEIRERIATDLRATLDTNAGVALSPDARARAKVQFERIGKILRGLN